jgi:UDP-N-acetylglucosamine 2-epimerase (non-hydrolysing)
VGIAIVYGTRPEAIKLGPVVAELRNVGITPQLISTGQHWDLLRGTPAETDLKDSISLAIPSKGETIHWPHIAQSFLAHTLTEQQASIVVVQGDTMSALAGARTGRALGIPVCHIEAGVRSGNLEEPWPEEGFRREITQLAQWHYAPTSTCFANLIAEGIGENRIRLTGNSVVSAMARYASVEPGLPKPYILLTMHRREWLERVDMPLFLGEVAQACFEHPQLNIWWPTHPHVAKHLPVDWTQPPNLYALHPLSYGLMINLLRYAQGLATDSGGLVEEATTLGIPTAILRNSNDRPEAVEAGIARQYPPESIQEAIRHLADIKAPRTPSNVFGTPQSAFHIATHLSTLV